MKSLNSLSVLGPVVKLARWFSWFESDKFFQGENYCNKLLMMEGENRDPLKTVNFIKLETITDIEAKGKISEKAELQQLKIAHGTWALSPLLVNPTSLWQKKLLALGAAQTWLHHSRRAKYVLDPKQVCEYTIKKAQGGWKEELMDLMLDSFYNPQVLKQLYPAKAVSKDVKDKRLSTHFEFISRLLAKRATSLASFFLLPPLRYAPILDPTWEFAGRQQMLYDWQAILYLEACNLAGKHVEGLSSLAFLDSSYCRLSYLLNEEGVLKKDDGDQIKTLLRHALMHLGDTACIESTHSSAKDSMRDARSNFKSRVSKYYHCIASKVLSSRKTSHVTISLRCLKKWCLRCRGADVQSLWLIHVECVCVQCLSHENVNVFN